MPQFHCSIGGVSCPKCVTKPNQTKVKITKNYSAIVKFKKNK